MRLAQYAKKRGVTIPLTVVARISRYTAIGLNTMYNSGHLDLLNSILDDAQSRFNSIVRPNKLKNDDWYITRARQEKFKKSTYKELIDTYGDDRARKIWELIKSEL